MKILRPESFIFDSLLSWNTYNKVITRNLEGSTFGILSTSLIEHVSVERVNSIIVKGSVKASSSKSSAVLLANAEPFPVSFDLLFTESRHLTNNINITEASISDFMISFNNELNSCFYNNVDFAEEAIYKRGAKQLPITGIFDDLETQSNIEDMLTTITEPVFHFPRTKLPLLPSRDDILFLRGSEHTIKNFWFDDYGSLFLVLQKKNSL